MQTVVKASRQVIKIPWRRKATFTSKTGNSEWNFCSKMKQLKGNFSPIPGMQSKGHALSSQYNPQMGSDVSHYYHPYTHTVWVYQQEQHRNWNKQQPINEKYKSETESIRTQSCPNVREMLQFKQGNGKGLSCATSLVNPSISSHSFLVYSSMPLPLIWQSLEKLFAW